MRKRDILTIRTGKSPLLTKCKNPLPWEMYRIQWKQSKTKSIPGFTEIKDKEQVLKVAKWKET